MPHLRALSRSLRAVSVRGCTSSTEPAPAKLDDRSLIPPFRFGHLASSALPQHVTSSEPTAASSSSPCPSPSSSTNSSSFPLYRGSLPRSHNLPFLDTLHLRTIISLTPKPISTYEENGELVGPSRAATKPTEPGPAKASPSLTTWARQSGVKLVHVKVGKAKDGAIPVTAATVKLVLELLINRTGYPIYLHDLDGSDVVAMMGAALRKLQGWSEGAWSEEMSRYLRQPPPEPEHLVFLRRLLPPTTNTSNNTASSTVPPSSSCNATPTKPLPSSSTLPDGIFVPKASSRVPWLWPHGFPGKKGVHASMKVIVEHDPTAATAHAHGAEEGGEGKRVFEKARAGKELEGGGGGGAGNGNGNGNGIGTGVGAAEGAGKSRCVVAGGVGEERAVHGSRSRSGETGEGTGTGGRQREASGNGSIVGGLENAEGEQSAFPVEQEEERGEEGDDFDEDEEDEEEDDDDEDLQVSKTIEALDLGL
ncbi:BZ3500_MvSof-1268-A1-R1_Chr2-1g04381 [Microbotryum saponariae]|uniref:BZ3500_MvSof-1268-A1-R1_Chr2-1g04381 protein n=1 Tax=Microbotryum saponariae TaxID=289078 RepID=A0A2X0MIU9_9BASI|nr:BZ3500_MvSof-1268-A1-R1_Chr2-1g04381 [Microbotryum saponariae]SCZ91595.1 BZ3501_MvSof-1269-A2-R1_Chr2-1g04037 [Microbotryum saponariae]